MNQYKKNHEELSWGQIGLIYLLGFPLIGIVVSQSRELLIAAWVIATITTIVLLIIKGV